jgi:uracil-DNA glycosylase
MSTRFICPKCGRSHFSEERQESMFCKSCNKFLPKKRNLPRNLIAPISEQVSDKKSFVKQIYSNVKNMESENNTYCDQCFRKHNFVKLKAFTCKPCFPPVGSSDTGQVLFIGTNPRCRLETRDEEFYRYSLKNEENFVNFSIQGEYESKEGYHRGLFDDIHYSLHKECLYNTNRWWRLGEKSSVAEIFMCASESSGIFNNVRNLTDYTCAENYLIKYIELVKPKIIVSFGSLALQWFQKKFRSDLKEKTQKLNANYTGNPLTDTITNLHSRFSKIKINSKDETYVVFSLHPGNYLKNIDRKRLIETFTYLASLQGFDNEKISN